MKKIYSDQLKELLPPLFQERFPEFKPAKPKLPEEWKGRDPLPLATTYFLRIDGTLWQAVGIRRSSHEELLLEIYWSRFGRWPWGHMGAPDLGRGEDDFLRVHEGHASSVQLFPTTVPGSWTVWECSVPPLHPDYIERYVKEIAVPVSKSEAEAAVRKALDALAGSIQDYVLPFFEKLRATELEEWPDPSILRVKRALVSSK